MLQTLLKIGFHRWHCEPTSSKFVGLLLKVYRIENSIVASPFPFLLIEFLGTSIKQKKKKIPLEKIP